MSRKIIGHCLLLILVLLTNGLWAQQVIKGTVVDENNRPFEGVSVILLGTKQGTSTNASGNFTINAKDGQKLVFSFVGYGTQQVAVKGAGVPSIKLLPDGKELGEVVVTALGIKKEVKKLGYSQSQIKGADLTTARDANPLNSLAGKVAGLQIGASAEFFGAPTVVLRGSKDILYVVDGQPVNSDTYNFNADDIESYTVLKGPNAAALYGFRGINGAIIITTKKGAGKEGWQIDFNSTTELDKGFIVLPESQTEYGRGSNFKYSYGNQLYDNAQRLPEWGPRFGDGYMTQQYDSPYDATTGVRQKTPWLARGADNFDKFVQNGYVSTNSIGLGAQGEKYNLRISYGHTFQRGIFPNTRLNIDNFKMNGGYDITKKLRLEADVNLSEQYSPNIPDVNYNPNSYVYMFKVYGSADYDIDDIKNYYQGPQGVPGLTQYAPEYGRLNNAWFMANEWLRSRKKSDVYGSMRAIYKFNDHANIALRQSLNTYNQLSTEDVPASANLNLYLPWYKFGWYGDSRQDSRRLMENNTDLIFNYDQNFGNWSFTALAGASQRSFTYDGFWGTTQGLSLPGVYNLNNSAAAPYLYNFNSKMQVYSGFYSIDLGYKNYFNINTTNRVDNLSTLPSGNNTYFYPSVALSSMVSDYVKLPKAISFLKVRASYADVKGGLTSPTIGTAYNALNSAALGTGWNSRTVFNLLGYGSEIYTPYNGPTYVNESAVASGTFYNGTPSLTLSNTIANSDLKPFDITSIEAGLDVKFFNNRLGLNATYFTTTNGPNIFQLPVSTATTFTNRLINGVTTKKDGIELELMGSVLKNPDGLNWDVNVNYSTYKETLKEIYGGEQFLQQNGHNYKVGERLDAIYGNAFVRDANGAIVHSGGLPLQSPGGIDNNAFLGYANPDFSFGIGNTFRYKEWSLSFQFDGRIGGKIYDYVYSQTLNGGTDLETASGAFGEARLREWQSTNMGTVAPTPSYVAPGVKIVTGTPRFANGQIVNMSDLTFAPNDVATTVQSYVSSGLYPIMERFMVDRSFAKLREVTIGYSLPDRLLKKGLIKKATFSLVGRNLLYFAAHKDIDLDQYASGYNASDRGLGGVKSGGDLSSPTVRRFGFNINLTF